MLTTEDGSLVSSSSPDATDVAAVTASVFSEYSAIRECRPIEVCV